MSRTSRSRPSVAAGPWRDRIGQRLDPRARVPVAVRHLVADDRARVDTLLSLSVAGPILDAGCSDGAVTRRLRARWPMTTVLGCDLHLPRGRGFVRHDLRQPWPRSSGGPFGAIFACEVFEHMTPAEARIALGHLRDALAPKGSLVITVPNRYPHDRYTVACRARWAWPDHRSAYSGLTLRAWLRGSFSILLPIAFQHEPYGVGPWLIMQAWRSTGADPTEPEWPVYIS